MPKPKPVQRPAFVSPGDYRSGRGGGVQGGPPETWYDRDALGDPPRATPQSGQTGDPSAAPSVTMSQIQQQGFADDEIEYWEDAAFDPPYLVHGDDMGQGHHHVRESALRAFVREVLEDMFEVSSLGGGAIRGYTTPMGTGGNDDTEERLDVSEKSFGGGEYVDKKG